MQVDDLGSVQARNVAGAHPRRQGAALGLDPWGLHVGATVQDPEDEQTGEQLLRRARESFTASVTRRFGPQEIGLDLLWSGDRKDFGFPEPVDLDSYTVVNLSGTMHLGQH